MEGEGMSDHMLTHVSTTKLDEAVAILGLTPAPGTHLIRLEIEAGLIKAEYAAVRRVTARDAEEVDRG